MSGWWDKKLKSTWKSLRSSYYWVGMLHELRYDILNSGELTWRQKIWSYRKGFFAYRITEYGLNEKNYRLFLPDFTYYRLHPINGHFHFWIDDKLTMKYILHPFDDILPKYYYYVGPGGQLIRLMDCPAAHGENLEDLLALLRGRGCLAAKMASGSRGVGFFKMAYHEGEYLLNDKPISQDVLLSFLSTKENYLITEWLSSHSDLSRIWAESTNSVRIVVFRRKDQSIRILGAYIKFGTRASGTVDNVSAGGITANVDIETGNFHDGRIFRHNRMEPIRVHPDSGVIINGNLPFWKEIKSSLNAIGMYLPHFRYMGFDITINQDGFKILEINSLPAIDILNCYQPLLADPEIAEFFKNLANPD